MARFTRARVRALLEQGEVSRLAQAVAAQLGIKPESAARQLYYYVSGARILSESYQKALGNVSQAQDVVRRIEAVNEGTGSLRATARRVAAELGIQESSARRQLQRMMRGERPFSPVYERALEKVKEAGDRQVRGRNRLRTLIESGRYDPDRLAKDLGISRQRLTSVLVGRSDLPENAIPKIDRRHRYITKERPEPVREAVPFDPFDLPGDAPAWAESALTGDPGGLYRFYAMYFVQIFGEAEYQKLHEAGPITKLLSPGLPGRTSPSLLMDLARDARGEIEEGLAERGFGFDVALRFIFRHPDPQPRI